MVKLPSWQIDPERQIATELRTGWIALATFLGLIALSVALIFAFQHAITTADDLSANDERDLVRRYVTRAIEADVDAEVGVVNWDDSVVHSQTPDFLDPRMLPAAYNNNQPTTADTIWLDRQMGHYAWATYNADKSFLMRSDGLLMRAWVDGHPTGDHAYQALRGPIRQLMATAMLPGHLNSQQTGMARLGTVDDAGFHMEWPVDHAGTILTRWAGGLVRTSRGIEIITVASVTPGHEPTLVTRPPAWFAMTQPLDPLVMAQARRALLLPDLGVILRSKGDAAQAPAGKNLIALEGVDGQPIGWIGWGAKSPGSSILHSASPMLWTWILLFPCVLIGGGVVLRGSWRTTRELVANEAQARHNALHDAMSGLPNRVHYMQRLRDELAAVVSGDARGDVFVGYIDLDAFKLVNDTLGHHVGDELVRQVALRLRGILPPSDFIARFGGDEFVVLRRGEGGRAMANQIGAQIIHSMDEPFTIAGNAISATCSCGISWGPAQSEDPGELLRRADIALYRAKQRGRGRYRCFTPDMDASVKLRLELETELRRAIARDELSMAYQPIVAFAGGHGDGNKPLITGVEALLRWNHPERGAIRPDLFVPVAEQGGLMIALGNWVLRHVFTECSTWPACDISVNLSPIQLMAGGFVKTIAAIVDETGMDPYRVVLEITEGVMLDRSEHVLRVLGQLTEMGFRIALDDFGSGYSSLSYLRQFEFERIKIDRSFISNIEGDADAQAILCAIASLGHSLRMKVVAEGVETEAQGAVVRAAGCELIQGFLYWRPMPAADVLPLLDPALSMKSLRSVRN